MSKRSELIPPYGRRYGWPKQRRAMKRQVNKRLRRERKAVSRG